jgi:hypothetical protein
MARLRTKKDEVTNAPAQAESTGGMPPEITNEEIAATFDKIAELLEVQDANPFRVRAYRTGAETIRHLSRPAADLLAEQGLAGLERLEGIGRSLARAIEQLVAGGKLPLLERLRGDILPAHVFVSVPGIGPELAERIHAHLEIENLMDLYAAASDGRLAQVPGFGSKRVRAVRESLEARLRRRSPTARPRPAAQPATEQPEAGAPPVADLLDVDREYRTKAAAGRLPTLAPRRFNPTGAAWLPVLHTARGNVHYSALYSNTARAHELGMTHDWVVIYRDDAHGDGQWTVITAQFGALRGKRVVRGRETESRAYYAARGELSDEPAATAAPTPAPRPVP